MLVALCMLRYRLEHYGMGYVWRINLVFDVLRGVAIAYYCKVRICLFVLEYPTSLVHT